MNIFNAINLKLTSYSILKQFRQHRVDIIIAVGLAIAISISTYIGTYQLPDSMFTDYYAQDTWFGSDIPTVFGNITSLNSDFGRNNRHPLFPLIIFPLVFVFFKLFHLDPLPTVRFLLVGNSMLWIGSLYALFRVMGCHRLDAVLFSLLGGVSAASIFWLIIPETYPFGSLTILLGLIFATLTQFHQFSSFWYVVGNVLTVSITITNSMVGLFTTFVNHRWRKAILITTSSLLLALGLWIFQRAIFKTSGFPFQPGVFIGPTSNKFITAPDFGGILSIMSSFFYQTMIMPAVHLLDSPIRPNWVKLDTNTLSPASGGIWGTIAVFTWTVLLGLGLWGILSIKQNGKLRIVLGLTLLAQLLMHFIFGANETFLYSLHFVPLLLTLAAFSLFTRFRLLSLFLVIVLIVSAGINNKAQFDRVASALWNYGTPQQRVTAQMQLRPSDPWPRNADHVILAKPGSSIEYKAFYESGGSFSPQAGSFGVSIWVVDRDGNIKATSDSIPLREIQQHLTELSASKIPSISSKTSYYEAFWSSPMVGHWKLNLKPLGKSDTQLFVVIRSVGPAGGEISSLNWDGHRLLIGDRWILKDIPKLAKVYVGSESTVGWSHDKAPQSHWKDPEGWGYARIELEPGDSLNLDILDILDIKDSKQNSESTLKLTEIPSNLTLDLPDQQFVDCLQAQIAHIMMGLVGNHTRPGDPISYPLPRFRDGAYQMVALAHAGQIDVAKQLSAYFAENDFFNSTLPEADIPALGIWALEEVAIALKQPDYDQWLWPHVSRKAELIGDMLSSNRPGYPVFSKAKSRSAAEFPFAEDPDFIRVDLSGGNMENTPGMISLDPSANAMSYLGLQNAARLADRVKQPNDAKRWRLQAEKLKAALEKSNQTDFSILTKGLWQINTATNQKFLTEALQGSWEELSDSKGAFKTIPQTFHSSIAEAHQWLFLNRPDRVWTTLKWVWQNQASPGLYTWSGTQNEPDEIPMPLNFSQWHRYRGWLNQSTLTPHYWTAAEMLLLQLDMLAYVDRASSSPSLVIGAGIQEKWLGKPISVKGLLVEGSLVNWNWDGKQLNVQIQGKKMFIKPGFAFPANTPVNVVLLQKEKSTM